MATLRNEKGMTLTPQMERVVAFHHLYPHMRWAEIGEKAGIKGKHSKRLFDEAMIRLGGEEGEEGFELRDAIRQGKRKILSIDRKDLAKKLMNIANLTVEQFLELSEDELMDMVKAQPQKMMITAAIAIDKADKLEDRPAQRIEVTTRHEIDAQLEEALLEYQRRKETEIDVTPSTETEGGSEIVVYSE